jgi:hypothetical protein
MHFCPFIRPLQGEVLGFLAALLWGPAMKWLMSVMPGKWGPELGLHLHAEKLSEFIVNQKVNV